MLQLFRVTRRVLFRFRIEKGPKVAEVEVTMPDGTKKTQEIFNDTALGYDARGTEVARVTIEEPTWVRGKEHLNSI